MSYGDSQLELEDLFVVPTFSNPYEPVLTFSNPSEPVLAFSNPSEPVLTFSDPSEPVPESKNYISYHVWKL